MHVNTAARESPLVNIMHIISVLGSNDSYNSVFWNVMDGKHYFIAKKCGSVLNPRGLFSKHGHVTVVVYLLSLV